MDNCAKCGEPIKKTYVRLTLIEVYCTKTEVGERNVSGDNNSKKYVYCMDCGKDIDKWLTEKY